ncbi:MAG: hypothetical protein NTV34_20470, partial [Proteobacteria bacterium]|nr:hypothetical protein [Pseudomonadota bacterium]
RRSLVKQIIGVCGVLVVLTSCGDKSRNESALASSPSTVNGSTYLYKVVGDKVLQSPCTPNLVPSEANCPASGVRKGEVTYFKYYISSELQKDADSLVRSDRTSQELESKLSDLAAKIKVSLNARSEVESKKIPENKANTKTVQDQIADLERQIAQNPTDLLKNTLLTYKDNLKKLTDELPLLEKRRDELLAEVRGLLGSESNLRKQKQDRIDEITKDLKLAIASVDKFFGEVLSVGTVFPAESMPGEYKLIHGKMNTVFPISGAKLTFEDKAWIGSNSTDSECRWGAHYIAKNGNGASEVVFSSTEWSVTYSGPNYRRFSVYQSGQSAYPFVQFGDFSVSEDGEILFFKKKFKVNGDPTLRECVYYVRQGN